MFSQGIIVKNETGLLQDTAVVVYYTQAMYKDPRFL
jgi:hypothetical protein